MYDDPISCISDFGGLFSGVYSVDELTFSGVPSFGGVGGKLKEADDEDEMEVAGWTDSGVVALGCVDLLYAFIHAECAAGTMAFGSVNQEGKGGWKCGLQTWLPAETKRKWTVFIDVN